VPSRDHAIIHRDSKKKHLTLVEFHVELIMSRCNLPKVKKSK